MQGIDYLEHGGGGFAIRHDGALIEMMDPRSVHYQVVLLALRDGHVTGTPVGIPEWKRALVFDR